MIEEFWIIDKSGICLYHRIKGNDTSKNEDAFEQLLGGLLTGILTVSKEVMASTLQKIESKGVKFLFFTENELIFVVKATINTSDNKIKKRIEILQDKFIKKFKLELENFDGDVTSFKQYEGELDEIFKEMSKSEKWGAGLVNL